MADHQPDDEREAGEQDAASEHSPTGLTRRQLLGGLGTIGVGSALGGTGSLAMLSDTERSAGNELVVGTLDLKVNGSDGATAGFNWDQTVAPGDTITYRWYAAELVDTAVLWDHADIRGHRHPLGGAGGQAESTGDFIYQEMKQRNRLEGGLWGFFRVKENVWDFEELVQPLPERAGDVPVTERPGWNVATGDVTAADGDDVLVGVPASDLGGVDAGAAYFFSAPVAEDDLVDLSGADLQILGTDSGAGLGTAVALNDSEVRGQAADDADVTVASDDAVYSFDDVASRSGTVVVSAANDAR